MSSDGAVTGMSIDMNGGLEAIAGGFGRGDPHWTTDTISIVRLPEYLKMYVPGSRPSSDMKGDLVISSLLVGYWWIYVGEGTQPAYQPNVKKCSRQPLTHWTCRHSPCQSQRYWVLFQGTHQTHQVCSSALIDRRVVETYSSAA
jgi:hypothetical protein